MRGSSAATKSLTEQAINSSKPKPKPPFKQIEAPGNRRKPTTSLPSCPVIDHAYITKILARKDCFLLLNHELKANRISLSPHLVVSILQNHENPLHPLKFYIWVCNIDPSLAKIQSFKSVLANALYRKGPVILSVELLQEIKSSSCRVTEDVLCVLIGSWGRLGLAKYCNEVFGQVSYLGLCPTTRLYNAAIDALVKSSALDQAYLKFQQMSADNCRPDRFTYNILIHGVCKNGVVDEALRLVKQMESLGYSPNVFTYTILIDGFCTSKRIEEAFKLLDVMKERNVSPGDATYRSLVYGVFRCRPPCEAFELLVNFIETKSIFPKSLCDTVLNCLSSNSMPREAAIFLRKIGDKGYCLDSATFNVIILCLLKGLDIDDVCNICDAFIEKGGKPGFNSYLALVEALYKMGKSQVGDRYLLQMFQEGLLTNVVSYNMILDCFSKVKMVDRALQKFEEMQVRGIVPNLVTFNTLISGHSKAGDISKAGKLLKMLLEQGLRPDNFTFSSIIDGLCRTYRTEDAFDCFHEMFEWGVKPNALTYNILIRSLCIVGDISRSMKLLKEMQIDGISPDLFSFNALIHSYCKMKKVEKARKLFVSMLSLGLSPDNHTYSIIVKALFESKRVTEALDVFHSMETNGCVPDSYICNLVTDALANQGRLEEICDSLKKCNERGIEGKCFAVM